MSASLVGSEMCIRDRFRSWKSSSRASHPSAGGGDAARRFCGDTDVQNCGSLQGIRWVFPSVEALAQLD
eukprot:10433838-Alexandrium_andersonii.AAC.1